MATLRQNILVAACYIFVWGVWGFLIAAMISSGFTLGVLFTWHPLLMITAFVLFMPHAILSYRAPYASGSQLPERRLTHGILQYTAAFTALLGFVIVLLHKIIHNYPTTPQSNHAIIGTVALSLVAFQLSVGFIKYRLLPMSYQFLRFHGYLGGLVWALALVAISFGVTQVGLAPPLLYSAYAVTATFFVVLFMARVALPWPKADTGMYMCVYVSS